MALPADGRIARGVRTRESVINAFEELINQDELPTGAELAARAGVSCRSIFTHFGDMEGVTSAATQRMLSRLRRIRLPRSSAATPSERIRLFVDQRATILERVTPLFSAAIKRRGPSPSIDRVLAKAHEMSRNIICDLFSEELEQAEQEARSALTNALVVVASWPHWHALRRVHALDVEAAKAVLRLELRALLRAE